VTPGADWPEQARRLAETLRGALTGAAAHVPPETGTVPECRWCPLCQLVAVLRGERPEVTAALADVLRATADALHAVAAAPEAPRREPAGTADRPDVPGHTDPPPVVQRIEIA
jgi:hypothetical protein